MPRQVSTARRRLFQNHAGNLAILLLIVALWPIDRIIDKTINQYAIDIIIRLGIAMILAASLNLINGITGQFSLGHAGFMAVGGYTAGVFLKHYYGDLPSAPPAAFLGVTILGGLLAAATGWLIGVPTLRLRGDYLAIATLGLGEIIRIVLEQVDTIGSFEVGGSSGLHGIPGVRPRGFDWIHPTSLFWTYAWAIVCVAALTRLVYSAKGKPFFALREDEVAAAATGVDTTYYKVTGFMIGAFFAGVAGALFATFENNLDPESFGFARSIEIVMAVVIGGSGSFSGSMLAAIVLTCIPIVLDQSGLPKPIADRIKDWRMVLYALTLILMMRMRPQGFLGRRELWPKKNFIAKKQTA